MLTLSNVDLFRAVLRCEVTAKPAVTRLVIVTPIDPTRVQFTPSAEANPLNVFSDRTSWTQYGATRPLTPTSCTALAPVDARYCILTPLPGVMNTSTEAEPGSVVSRIITPDFAQAFVFC